MQCIDTVGQRKKVTAVTFFRCPTVIDIANTNRLRSDMGMIYVMGRLIRLNNTAPTPCPHSQYWETSGNEQSNGNSSIVYYISGPFY